MHSGARPFLGGLTAPSLTRTATQTPPHQGCLLVSLAPQSSDLLASVTLNCTQAAGLQARGYTCRDRWAAAGYAAAGACCSCACSGRVSAAELCCPGVLSCAQSRRRCDEHHKEKSCAALHTYQGCWPSCCLIPVEAPYVHATHNWRTCAVHAAHFGLRYNKP